MITDRLAAYISGALDRTLPADVAEKAVLHILDTVAAIVSGSQLKAGVAIPYVVALGDRGESSVLASKVLTSPAYAALANGMSGHADESDDSHVIAMLHPGCVVVSAALAVAEKVGSNGTEFVRAVSAGYDIGARMSLAIGAYRLADRYHLAPQSWGGVFGATAAASALLRLDHVKTVHALSYAVQKASGNRCWLRDPDHIQKAFIFGGLPASAGVECAMMAAAGFTGVADAIEGDPGLIAAFPDTADPNAATDALGERFELMRTTIKKWSAGSPLQAPLDCIDTIVKENSLAEPDVASIAMTLPEERMFVIDSHMPDINLPYVMALYLVDGVVGFASLHDHTRMTDPEILRVAERISVTPRPGAGRRDMVHFTLTTTDGRKFHMEPKTVRGQLANPMTKQEIADKALDLLGDVLGADRGQALVAQILELPKVANIRDIRHLWQA